MNESTNLLVWGRVPLLPFFLMVMCLGIAGRMVFDQLGSYGLDPDPCIETKAQIDAFKTALDLYEVENHHYPGTNGLTDLVVKPPDASGEWHQYLDQLPSDPWGHPYRYESPGKHNTNSFDLSSAGPDGKFDTSDDIGNWDELKR